MDADTLISELIRREGGYVDHPFDRGGATNFGITIDTLRNWRGRPIGKQDVMELSEEEARLIYRRNYIQAPGFDLITPPELMGLMVDWGVNSGPKWPSAALQRLIGEKPDGVIGPDTLKSWAKVDETRRAALYKPMLAARCRFIAAIPERDSSQMAFFSGWCNRLAEFAEGAIRSDIIHAGERFSPPMLRAAANLLEASS